MAIVNRSHPSSSDTTHRPDCFSYDVFLSFRGEDTRKSFTDHLYTALKRVGIRTFRDDDSMERGRLLGQELEKAIRLSRISIIVFSRNYASSKWCLDEVLTIIKEQERLLSKHEVLPVFYNVEPSDVRNQKGSFAEAFTQYEDTIEAEKVEEWRDSLRKAAGMTGMILADGHEAEFISKIVNVLRKKLDYKVLYIEDNLVGINDDVSKIESWLQDPSPNAVILLVEGMGGIGKTTIAKCIYNSNYRDYDGSCFLSNINETSNQPGGLLNLQSQLMSTILKSEKEEVIWNVEEGSVKVMDAICNKKVLLILDDVATIQQLDALLGRQSFYPRSKVIITTRHKWLINAFRVHPNVHTIRTLCRDDSVELFSLYAFHQHHPIEPYIVQSKQAVLHCEGLPLALKVLGSYLRGKNTDEWEDALCKLEEVCHPGIQKVLQLSYEMLEDGKDKDLFLHIACFFVGEEKDYIVKLLSQCGLYPVVGIKNLKDRCLLTVDHNGRVMMHQLIKEMGRDVVRQESPKYPGERSRLWQDEDCFNVLREHAGTIKVEGLMLDMRKIKDAINLKFNIAALEKMKNLMLLQLNFVTFSGKYRKLPKKLRLLSWHGFPLKSIAVDIPLETLIILDMSYSKLKCVWDDFKFIGSLKILNLSNSVELIETPDFGGLPGLESLILKGCISLIKVDESIAYLEGLLSLDLTDCRSLRDFPPLPRSLVSLHMSGCSNHGVFERFQCLDSSSLPSLVRMNISNCNLFDKSFPDDWSSLVSLKVLNIDGNNVTCLPKCIQTLPRINSLTARWTKLQSITGIPKSVWFFHIQYNNSLERVRLAGNRRASVYHFACKKLCDMEGRFKRQSISKVDKKIIQYLGLEAITGEEQVEVLHEFGIFSTFVSEKQIPSCFMYKEKGPTISFKVPSHHNNNNSRIIGFSMCVVVSPSTNYERLMIGVCNKTKELSWGYVSFELKRFPLHKGRSAWISLWRCDNLLEDGDEIFICVIDTSFKQEARMVEECCINLLYEDEDDIYASCEENEFEADDGEREEDGHHVNVFDQISWTDRMFIDISDYVDRGKRCMFTGEGEAGPPLEGDLYSWMTMVKESKGLNLSFSYKNKRKLI